MSKQSLGTRKSSNSGSSRGGKPRAQTSLAFEISNTKNLSEICGSHDRHLALIEQALDVYLVAKGNVLTVEGGHIECRQAQAIIEDLNDRLEQGLPVDEAEVAAAIRMVQGTKDKNGDRPKILPGHQINTLRRVISPRSPTQARYMEALQNHDLVFGLGPAGTGKTYLAVAVGVSMLLSGQVDRLILSRPAVEAGESLGFLPGDMREKVDPYLRPLYDAMHDMMPAEQVTKRLERGEIEVAPLAFMRGRTLSNAYVILDEAQNCLPMQIKMFLTRLGENARMVVTGDPTQVDLPSSGPRGVKSGLSDALEILEGLEGVGTVRFSEEDVVRHPLVARIIRAYNERENG